MRTVNMDLHYHVEPVTEELPIKQVAMYFYLTFLGTENAISD